MQLRPYQQECIERLLAKFREYSRLLAVLPTGAGKTIILAALAHRMQPLRSLVIAHREELINQAVDKIRAATGLEAEVEKAEARASLEAPVVVASVQTLAREQRRGRWPRDHFALVVIDEAHHVLAESYQSVVGHFHEHAKVLGVTATPDRGDKRSLGEYFSEVGFEIGLHDLIKQGYLCRITVKTVPLQIDLGGVRTVAGDFSDADLGDAIEPYLRQIVAEMKAAIGSRKTLVFLPLIRTSQRFVELCREAGLTAEHVDGQSENRQAILARYAAGEFQILANSLLLTEGFDEPSVSCVVCLRPTKIRAMYSQIIGRGTRLHETKENLLVLDFLWHTERHALVRPAHLVATSTPEADSMTAILEAAAREFGPGEGGAEEQDLLDLIDDAKEQREAKLARELAQNARRRGQQLDPVEFALSLHAMDLAEWEPTMRWHEEPPTDRQLTVLTNLGFAPDAIRSKGYASQLLDRIFTRKELKLASPKQVMWLRRTGHPSPETATMEEAKAYLSQQFTR